MGDRALRFTDLARNEIADAVIAWREHRCLAKVPARVGAVLWFMLALVAGVGLWWVW
jgi:hypothetical protein